MKSYNIEIEETADGSDTLYRSDMDEHYHSVKGAMTESEHIYLKLGWEMMVAQKPALRIFEVGFGTGLNAALTANAALLKKQPTEYYSIELYPLSPKITEKLHYHKDDDFRKAFSAVNNANWNESTEINPYFTIHKLNADLLSAELPQTLDVVYFDAFAPEKQPEMWQEKIFQRFYEAMNSGACLVTYCAKGNIRRMLNQIGFLTERLPGPPGGKREVLRATKAT